MFYSVFGSRAFHFSLATDVFGKSILHSSDSSVAIVKNEEIQLEQLHLFVQQKHLRQKQLHQVLWTLQKWDIWLFLFFFIRFAIIAAKCGSGWHLPCFSDYQLISKSKDIYERLWLEFIFRAHRCHISYIFRIGVVKINQLSHFTANISLFPCRYRQKTSGKTNHLYQLYFTHHCFPQSVLIFTSFEIFDIITSVLIV